PACIWHTRKPSSDPGRLAKPALRYAGDVAAQLLGAEIIGPSLGRLGTFEIDHDLQAAAGSPDRRLAGDGARLTGRRPGAREAPGPMDHLRLQDGRRIRRRPIR